MLKEVSIPTGSNEQHIRGSGSEQVVGSNSTPPCTEQLGIYVGEGMTPVPKKLAEKTWWWEFVDMGELLPDSWAQGSNTLYHIPNTIAIHIAMHEGGHEHNEVYLPPIKWCMLIDKLAGCIPPPR